MTVQVQLTRARVLAVHIVGIATFAVPALGWDSAKRNPTHPTHTYLTEYAIERLKGEFPELGKYEKQVVEGANEELHETKVKGSKHGVDLEARRVEHKGTNEGCDDIAGWWSDSLAAYRAGEKERAYFLLGIMLHMVQDMGVPAHANKVHHQGNLTEFDNFEFMALSNWKPNFDNVNRVDPAYAEPWKYYEFSRDWTHADAPNYKNRDEFSKSWSFAKPAEKALLSNRQGRTCRVVTWAMKSACLAFRGS